MKPLFVLQQNLEAWIEQGEAMFQDDVLRFSAKNVAYKLEPAVQITELLAGEDVSQLLGEIYLLADLKTAGAEHCRDSVILGDTAYGCEEGFVCIQAGQVTTAASSQAPTESTSDNAAKSDVDLLAEFMLKHL
jgi:hypothetical protein